MVVSHNIRRPVNLSDLKVRDIYKKKSADRAVTIKRLIIFDSNDTMTTYQVANFHDIVRELSHTHASCLIVCLLTWYMYSLRTACIQSQGMRIKMQPDIP